MKRVTGPRRLEGPVTSQVTRVQIPPPAHDPIHGRQRREKKLRGPARSGPRRRPKGQYPHRLSVGLIARNDKAFASLGARSKQYFRPSWSQRQDLPALVRRGGWVKPSGGVAESGQGAGPKSQYPHRVRGFKSRPRRTIRSMGGSYGKTVEGARKRGPRLAGKASDTLSLSDYPHSRINVPGPFHARRSSQDLPGPLPNWYGARLKSECRPVLGVRILPASNIHGRPDCLHRKPGKSLGLLRACVWTPFWWRPFSQIVSSVFIGSSPGGWRVRPSRGNPTGTFGIPPAPILTGRTGFRESRAGLALRGGSQAWSRRWPEKPVAYRPRGFKSHPPRKLNTAGPRLRFQGLGSIGCRMEGRDGACNRRPRTLARSASGLPARPYWPCLDINIASLGT